MVGRPGRRTACRPECDEDDKPSKRAFGFAVVAGEVKEQTATTSELGRNVAEAAGSSQDIDTDIAGVASAVGSTSAEVDEAHRSAQQLARTSGELYRIVAEFRL